MSRPVAGNYRILGPHCSADFSDVQNRVWEATFVLTIVTYLGISLPRVREDGHVEYVHVLSYKNNVVCPCHTHVFSHLVQYSAEQHNTCSECR